MGTRTGNPTWANAPATTSPISATALQNIENILDASAPVDSPTFTGDPKAPTPATADNDTSIATTAYVKAQGYVQLAGDLTGTAAAPTVVASSTTVAGKVELATTAETTTGTDTVRAVTPAGVQATRGLYVGVNAQTGTTYTPVLADQGKLVTLNNAASITVSLPQDSAVAFPVGSWIDFLVIGAGSATFAAGTGATVNGASLTGSQWRRAVAIKRAANTWTIDLAPTGGSGIPATTVDAKGDLIAATANDTVARLPVGTNGQFLSADSAEATGLKWVAAGGSAVDIFPRATGTWIGQSSDMIWQQSNNGQMPNGWLWCELLILTAPATVDAMGVSIQTAAGTAGSLIRLGVYSITSTGDIGTRLIDAGTTAATVTGDKQLTHTAVVLPAGTYWMVGVSNDASGTLRVKATSGSAHYASSLTSVFQQTILDSYAHTYVYYTGYNPASALPTTGTLTGRTLAGAANNGVMPEAPLFWVRKSA